MKKISFLVGLICLVVLNANAQESQSGYKFPTEENIIYDICFTHDGGAIGIADGKSIKVYSVETKELIRDFKNGHAGQILSIDISGDSAILVSGGTDSTVVIWDFKEGMLLKSLKCNGILTSVCLSPDSRLLAYGGSENKVSVYDLVNEEIIFTFSDHSDDITAIAFSSNGKYIASSSGDKLINIYENGSLISTLSGHLDWVRDISINSDDTRLISCGDDSKIINWNISDIKNPKIIRKSKSGFHWLTSVDFNQDKVTYACADYNGNAEIIAQIGTYKTKVKSTINKILFKPNEDIHLKIAIATSGNGVFLIDANNMTWKD